METDLTTRVAVARGVELRAVEDGSGFTGLACRYGVEDAYGTTFMPGCFTRGGLDTTGVYSLLWQHDTSRPVGTFRVEERGDGLYIEGSWDANTAGQEARAAALSGSAADLSVGFQWLNDSEELISEARLLEVSQVTSRFGAVPGSSFTAVRVAPAGEGLAALCTLDSLDAPAAPENPEAENPENPEPLDTPTHPQPAGTPAHPAEATALAARARIL